MNSTARLAALAPAWRTIVTIGVLAVLGFVVYLLAEAFIDIRNRSYLRDDADNLIVVLAATPLTALRTLNAQHLCFSVFSEDRVEMASCGVEGDVGRSTTLEEKHLVAELEGKFDKGGGGPVHTTRYGRGASGAMMTLNTTALKKEGKLFVMDT